MAVRPLAQILKYSSLERRKAFGATNTTNDDIMKPTQTLGRRISRLALTTKMTNKGYYKGTGTGSTGTHTKHGGYIIDWAKVRTYVVPKNLADFKVRRR